MTVALTGRVDIALIVVVGAVLVVVLVLIFSVVCAEDNRRTKRLKSIIKTLAKAVKQGGFETPRP